MNVKAILTMAAVALAAVAVVSRVPAVRKVVFGG